MGKQFQATINATLEDTFLLVISFVLVTELLYIGLHVQLLLEWIEQMILFGSGNNSANNDNDQDQVDQSQVVVVDKNKIAYTLLVTLMQPPTALTDLVSSFIFECIKLYLLVTALLCVTQVWKLSMLGFFVLTYGFVILCSWVNPDDVVSLAPLSPSVSSSVAELGRCRVLMTRVQSALLIVLNASQYLAYLLTIGCFVNFIYIYWDDIRNHLQVL